MGTKNKGFDKLISDLAPDKARGVMATALNTTTRMAQTKANQATRQHYNIKAGDLKKYESIKKANRNNLSTTLKVTGEPVPLYAFAGQSFVAKTKGAKKYFGASAKPLKSAGRKRYNAFPAVMKSGHLGIFRQTGKRMKSNPKRMAIQELKMITSATMFALKGETALWMEVDAKLIKSFMREYERQVWKSNNSK